MSMEAIKDANAFTIGKSETYHRPHRMEGVRVSATCGAYGFSDFFAIYPNDFKGQDFETRPAEWADGYSGSACERCDW